MSSFVLVHGGWAGGWVWEDVVPLLEARGHAVAAPDLPAHGEDRTPVTEASLDAYVERVLAVVDASSEPVVLVGHSSGGVVVTQAAERRPERVRRLVYVCAYLPADGQTLVELGQTDEDQLVLPNLVFSEDGTTALVRREAVREALFADCDDEAYERYLARIVPEPMSVAVTPVSVTAERFGRVPRAYVECLRDRGISPSLQRRMHEAVPCDRVLTLDCGHMAQYAAPRALASHLDDLARD